MPDFQWAKSSRQSDGDRRMWQSGNPVQGMIEDWTATLGPNTMRYQLGTLVASST